MLFSDDEDVTVVMCAGEVRMTCNSIDVAVVVAVVVPVVVVVWQQ